MTWFMRHSLTLVVAKYLVDFSDATAGGNIRKCCQFRFVSAGAGGRADLGDLAACLRGKHQTGDGFAQPTVGLR